MVMCQLMGIELTVIEPPHYDRGLFLRYSLVFPKPTTMPDEMQLVWGAHPKPVRDFYFGSSALALLTLKEFNPPTHGH